VLEWAVGTRMTGILCITVEKLANYTKATNSSGSSSIGIKSPGLPVVLKFLKCHRCPEIVLKSAIVLKFYSFGQNVLIWTLIFKFVAPGGIF